MKRLGLYVFACAISLCVIGGFLSSEKVYGAVTPNDLPPIINSINNAWNTPEVDALITTPSAQQIKNSYITQFEDLATMYFSSIRNDASITPTVLRFEILDRVRAQLNRDANVTTTTQTRERKAIALQYVGEVRRLAETALIDVQREQGVITNDQAQAEREIVNAEAVQRIQNIADAKNPDSCGFWDGNLMGCIDSLIAWLIKHTLLNIAGFLVWVSANMLNYSIQLGILNFSSWAPDSLYPIWIIVRQIVSLFMVFAGLYLAFMYIIGRDDKFKKYIPWVIIYALFVNLSYPLIRIPIDISNIIALNIYSSSIGNDALGGGLSNNAFTGGNTPGSLIMSRLGLQGLVLSATGPDVGTAAITNNISSTPGALLAVAFVLYAAFIFFMITAMMIARLAILVFLIIGSPILFVDSVVPALGEHASRLRKLFFEQLVLAPVFMVMLALTLKFLEVFQSTGPLRASGGIVSVANGSIVTFFNVLMMLVMLHIMYKVTKSISGSAGNYATNALGKVGGFGLGVATGGAGLLARGTIGKAAMGLRDSAWVTNNQDKFMGRRLYNMSNSLATSTYDARNTNLIGGGLKKVGMPLGAGSKLNFIQERQAKADDRAERYGRIKTETKDGKMDLDGTNAKARFFNKSGGVFTDKKFVQNALLDKDHESAIKDNFSLRRSTRKGAQVPLSNMLIGSAPTTTTTTPDPSAPLPQLANTPTEPTGIKTSTLSNNQSSSAVKPTPQVAANDEKYDVKKEDLDTPAYLRKGIKIEGVTTPSTESFDEPIDLTAQDFKSMLEQRRIAKQNKAVGNTTNTAEKISNDAIEKARSSSKGSTPDASGEAQPGKPKPSTSPSGEEATV